MSFSASESTICNECRCHYPIALATDAPIASAPCPVCAKLNYVSRYRRIDIGLSEVCNLTCNMCRRPQEREFMSAQRVQRLLSEARMIGVRTISFSGGEPFVHPEFRSFLESALDHGFDVELVTNGTLLRPSDIPNIERMKCITVSVDGPREIHDFIRGKEGAWDRTMETLRLLAASSAKWGTNTVIQAHNAGAIFETWRAISAVGRPSYLGFTHVEVVPETAHLQPSPAQAAEAKRQVGIVRTECIASQVHFNDEEILTRMYDVFSDKNQRYRPIGGCRIPTKFLGVSQYGVFPCWHQGRAIQADGLIEALETELCRDIVREAIDRRCIGCNAANYSWSKSWVEGIVAAHAASDSANGVVFLSAREREAGARPPGRRTLPILEREMRCGD